ncbi:zinc-binding dehydrogenase [Nocardioides sp. zg-579]|uniref:Zinc-binding dehydrogenase n=1 Tax=Nocardioides marmotae TaxID=2663857 RepID=A0A6I3JHE8_9ACTN|nr:NADPH:quinone reductase [Nocardioides marmotae]MCR6033744.1 zinc-binding dehydrogenase [Gordonia jinghuaiqii]MTB97402.1 zinc-binding dehydrogenase [Nocardioides marmotae]QKE01737.1 NADPH:quinone reductase [Nocardioides marmotae]
MRAVVYRQTGPSSVLEVVDREVPEPGPGEVRVRLLRAGVNPTDWKFRAGMMSGYDEVTPGQDGAGVVDAVGPGAEGFVVGDRVWVLLAQHGRAHGTAAEQVVLPTTRVVHLPAGASYDVGAALGVPAVTAHRALTSGEDVDRLAPGALAGRTVLVAGGAGAVGNAAIQLARWAGATVVTTVSSAEKAALATAAGAHHTVNYRVGDPAAEVRAVAPDGVDLVVEVAPAQNNDLDRAVARVRGTIAIYANNGGDEFSIPVRETFSKNLRYQFVLLYTLGEDLLRAATEDITAALTDGAFAVGEEAGVPLHHLPLEETAAAHDAVEAGTVGKVLLRIAEE